LNEVTKPCKDSIADPAGKVKVTDYNGLPTLVLYMHIGFKYYDKDFAVYLAWENGKFKPVDIKIEPTQDNSIDE